MNIRPSSLPALAQCPCFIPDQATGQDDKTAGTDRHEALFRYLGDQPSALEELPEGDRDGVEWAGEYIRTHAPMSGHPLVREEKRSFVTSGFEEIHGTPDVTCGAELFDLKWREDVSDYTPQMAAYSLMMPAPVVRVHILFALHKRAVTFTLTKSEADAIVEPIVERATMPNKQPTACDYCGWCERRVTCPAVKGEVKKAEAGKPADQIETADEMGAALRTARVVKDWAEAVEKAAKEMAFKRGMIPTGFKPCQRKGNRKIEDVQKAFGRVGIPQDEFLAACKITWKAIVDKYAAFHGMKKKPAERDVENKLGEVITRGPTVNYLQAETGPSTTTTTTEEE